MRKLVSWLVGTGLALLGVAIVAVVAWLGWALAGDEWGGVLGVLWLACLSTGGLLVVGLRLFVERRTSRVRWVWTRRDLLALAVGHVTALPSRAGVLDVAHGPCWDGARFFTPRFRRQRRPVADQVAAAEPLLVLEGVGVDVATVEDGSVLGSVAGPSGVV
jgi:hypothetical protein